LLALTAYLIGSIPFGWIVARLVAGVDLRTVGSGNIGATNASRLLGRRWGITGRLLDALKGLLPSWLLPGLLTAASDGSPHAAVLAGTSAILGHMYPIWLGFRGGKGVATALGVALVLAPAATALAAIGFLLIFVTTKVVSSGSLLGATLFAIYQAVALQPRPFSSETWSLALFSAVVPALIVLRHRSNLWRLIRGEEQALVTARPSDVNAPQPPTAPVDASRHGSA
jgi:glycerol-3-phosphate acyltransferase PlsY